MRHNLSLSSAFTVDKFHFFFVTFSQNKKRLETLIVVCGSFVFVFFFVFFSVSLASVASSFWKIHFSHIWIVCVFSTLKTFDKLIFPSWHRVLSSHTRNVWQFKLDFIKSNARNEAKVKIIIWSIAENDDYNAMTTFINVIINYSCFISTVKIKLHDWKWYSFYGN